MNTMRISPMIIDPDLSFSAAVDPFLCDSAVPELRRELCRIGYR